MSKRIEDNITPENMHNLERVDGYMLINKDIDASVNEIEDDSNFFKKTFIYDKR